MIKKISVLPSTLLASVRWSFQHKYVGFSHIKLTRRCFKTVGSFISHPLASANYKRPTLFGMHICLRVFTTWYFMCILGGHPLACQSFYHPTECNVLPLSVIPVLDPLWLHTPCGRCPGLPECVIQCPLSNVSVIKKKNEFSARQTSSTTL